MTETTYATIATVGPVLALALLVEARFPSKYERFYSVRRNRILAVMNIVAFFAAILATAGALASLGYPSDGGVLSFWLLILSLSLTFLILLENLTFLVMDRHWATGSD